MIVKARLFVIFLAALAQASLAQLPPVPTPPENPVTEPKRVLGKILFWDEQLSSDDTVACGTCHRPAAGGADPRAGVFPGEQPGSIDDVAGSPGIRRLNPDGEPVPDPVFGDQPQVTTRTSPSNFGALWADSQFWDGRASGSLAEPESGAVLIFDGAGLENQVLATLLNDREMAKSGRTWQELTDKLAGAAPLALADQWPADMASAIQQSPTYPDLFEQAFGDPAITPGRIAMAIAGYQRTLVADQTPWDLAQAGDPDAMSMIEGFGWSAFQSFKCVRCHEPPLFTTNEFANIGLRRSRYDNGRATVTGDPEHAGDMKIPSLRNVGLRPRYTHTGEFRTLIGAISFYRDAATLPEVSELPGGGAYAFSMSVKTAADVETFLSESLTDPRVAAETFPFDRPRLASER